MTFVDWYSVMAAASDAASYYKSFAFSGVYGVPRGGMVLAVLISHKMGIPVLKEPDDECLIVDDCYETGQTLDAFYEENPGAAFYVLAAKKPFAYGVAYREVDNEQWIVFPWEDKEKALADQEAYYASRQ